MSEVHAIQSAIAEYAMAYSKLQAIQKSSSLIPKGDQKTGCIGEFYIRLYARGKYQGATVGIGGHSVKGWDLLIELPNRVWKVQTKTVSAFSTTRRLSPIHEGWDELFILYLDEDFLPTGFWVVPDNSLVAGGKCIRNCSCPHPNGRYGGSRVLRFGPNRIQEFRQYVQPQLEAGAINPVK